MDTICVGSGPLRAVYPNRRSIVNRPSSRSALRYFVAVRGEHPDRLASSERTAHPHSWSHLDFRKERMCQAKTLRPARRGSAAPRSPGRRWSTGCRSNACCAPNSSSQCRRRYTRRSRCRRNRSPRHLLRPDDIKSCYSGLWDLSPLMQQPNETDRTSTDPACRRRRGNRFAAPRPPRCPGL